MSNILKVYNILRNYQIRAVQWHMQMQYEYTKAEKAYNSPVLFFHWNTEWLKTAAH